MRNSRYRVFEWLNEQPERTDADEAGDGARSYPAAKRTVTTDRIGSMAAPREAWETVARETSKGDASEDNRYGSTL